MFRRSRGKLTDAQIALLFARSRPQGNVPVTLPFTFLAVDPQNSSGHASDANPGTLLLPIETTDEANRRLVGRLTGDLTIDYLSDDTSGTGLLVQSLAQGGFNIVVQQTRVVVHARGLGTLDAGTTTINPAAAGGGQSQTAHTTDLANWAPFVVTRMGGAAAAANPTRLLDIVTGSSAWVADGASSATAELTRPTNPDQSAGAVTSGNGYEISRGGILTLAAQVPPESSGGTVTFFDCAFTATSVGPEANQGFSAQTVFYMRCSFLAPLTVGGNFFDCAYVNGWQGNWIASMTAGLHLPDAALDQQTGAVNLSGDLYVTGPSSLVVGSTFVQSIFLSPGIGAGVQIQNVQQTTGAILLLEGATYFSTGLLWGKGNAARGLEVGAATQISTGSTTPSVTGAAGDFVFSPNIAVARAWDDAAGAYTEAGGPATRATTWANFVATIGAGGFALQAHCVQIGSSLIG